MGTQPVIELKNVSKSFGAVKAVRGVTLTINKGEVIGIIGANGAGKTTTLEMMMGLTKPDSGSVRVLGMNPTDNEDALKQRIGIQLQSTSLYDRIKVKEALHLFQSYFDRKRDLQEIISALQLEPYLNKYVKSLSGGWQQRTALALALVNDPDVIFLDEPTTGLDPQARRELWDVLHKFQNEGKTILLSTHYMEEAHKMCDRILIIRAGELVAFDTPEGLIAQLPGGQGTMDDVYVNMVVTPLKGGIA